MKKIFNKISLKIGILFSGIFLILLLLLSYMLYGLFFNFFINFITQDLLQRGENHAKALEENYSLATLNHVTLMEKGVVTSVIVTDEDQNIVAFSEPITDMAKTYLLDYKISESKTLNNEWNDAEYIVTVSPIEKGNKGYVYMFYPTNILQEVVLVIRISIFIAIIGTIILGISIIGLFSKWMAKPLLIMKEATIRISKGDYQQSLNIKGNDELAQLGQSIQSLGEQLNYYDNSRNQFLTDVSHELRTPLTYIKGYSDVLRKGMIKNEKDIKRYLDIIYEETERVNNLVKDLFNIAKIHTGEYELHKEVIEINQLIEQVVQALVPLASNKGLKINFQKKEPLLLNIDPERMKQLFYNLIENAIKYTNKGNITITIKDYKHNVKIIISDTGIGIPKEDLARIWERFYRVEKSRDRNAGGTGIGLYVVKQIISLHGGEINVKSKMGEGTTFTISLRKDVVA